MSNGLLKIIRWVLIALGVMLLLAIIVLVFTKPNSSKQSGNTNTTEKPIVATDYSKTGSMRFIQVGNVTAPENHYNITITISNTTRTVDIYNGYGTPPTTTNNFPNNQASYDAFLGAMVGAGFTDIKQPNNGITFDTYCTLGIRYKYQILTGTETPLNSWNSTCNPKSGTFAGNTSQAQQLFTRQIPNYGNIVGNVRL